MVIVSSQKRCRRNGPVTSRKKDVQQVSSKVTTAANLVLMLTVLDVVLSLLSFLYFLYHSYTFLGFHPPSPPSLLTPSLTQSQSKPSVHAIMNPRNNAKRQNAPKGSPKPPPAPRLTLDGLSSSSSSEETSSDDSSDELFQLKRKSPPSVLTLAENNEKLHNSDGLLPSSVSETDNPGTKKTFTLSSCTGVPSYTTPAKQVPQILSSPIGRTLKKDELYPTSEESEEEANTSDSKQVKSPLQSKSELSPKPMQTTLPVAQMPSHSKSPSSESSEDDDIQFVGQRTRHLKKCTTYRPTDTLSLNLTDDAKETANVRTVFSNDPTRSPPVTVSKEEIDHLRTNNFLTTNMLDYLTQHAVPKDIPDHVLIGSTNSFRFFEIQNEKDIDSQDDVDARTA